MEIKKFLEIPGVSIATAMGKFDLNRATVSWVDASGSYSEYVESYTLQQKLKKVKQRLETTEEGEEREYVEKRTLDDLYVRFSRFDKKVLDAINEIKEMLRKRYEE